MILIIDCGSAKTPLIEEMVYEFDDTLVVPLLDFCEADLQSIHGVVISGAPILITEVDTTPFLEKFTWLKTTVLPVLGICFGHQMMGLTYGALANRQREDRDWQIVEIIHACSLFDRMPTEIEFMEDHCESISIPPDFIHVGVSDATVNEAMMHKEKPLYGVQFHPEVSGNMGAILFENFVNICKQEMHSEDI
jgi:GMP synthase (glutamine-hydrolysing)